MQDRSPRVTNPPSTRLFVGNLDYQISESELKNAISENLGLRPVDLHIATDRETGRGKGFAFVTFGSLGEAQKALTMLNGFFLISRPLRADYATERVNPNPRPKHGAADHRHRQPEVSERRARSFGPSPRSSDSDYDRTWSDSGDGRNRRHRR
jgi:cold-inducible RNA-binding protein